MKRYLIRAGFNPTQLYTPKDYLLSSRSIIGNNNGNLLYAYGVMNAIKTEEVEYGFLYEVDRPALTDIEISFINENYDAFIIPMADAFRPQYIQQLKWYTNLIHKLSIPVIIIGIGMQASYEPDLGASYIFDTSVYDFVSAVLDHSSLIGLRGEITGSYLNKLGFKEDLHYTPIGCPSLYTYGDSYVNRPAPSIDALENGRLLFNANAYQHEFGSEINDFILNSIRFMNNHIMIQQITYEFYDLYIDKYLIGNKSYINKILEKHEYEKLKKENSVKYFLDAPSWIDYCRRFTLFIGNRFHGCVAAILSGIPYVFIPFNARTREMVEFHHLTHINHQELKVGQSIVDNVEKLYFNSLEKQHHHNFEHYLAFLNKNGLESIFSKKKSYKFGESPLEKKVCLSSPFDCYNSLTTIKKISRIIKTNMWNLGGKFR